MLTYRLLGALLLSSLALVSCSDGDEDREPGVGGNARPCDLFTPEDASSLLDGVEVEELDFVDIVEAGNGPIPDAQRPSAEAAARKMCVYGTGPERFAAVQLDPGLFRSIEEFRGAWGEEVEILDEPGLAAAYAPPDEDGAYNADALLNSDGDSVHLTVRGSDVGKERLLEALAELVERY